jgi:hypothetical protein
MLREISDRSIGVMIKTTQHEWFLSLLLDTRAAGKNKLRRREEG